MWCNLRRNPGPIFLLTLSLVIDTFCVGFLSTTNYCSQTFLQSKFNFQNLGNFKRPELARIPSGNYLNPPCLKSASNNRFYKIISLRSMSSSTSTSDSSSSTHPNMNTAGKLSVMFICLGNICRSPTAEAVFKGIVENESLQEKFDKIESCGTGGGNPSWYQEGGWGYHDGENADERMAMTARKRGINLTSKSISLTKSDVESYDYLIVMEEKNKRAVLEAAAYWGIEPIARDKVKLICDYSSPTFKQKYDKVPDPYYGGTEGFETVLDLLDDACKGLLKAMVKEEK